MGHPPPYAFHLSLNTFCLHWKFFAASQHFATCQPGIQSWQKFCRCAPSQLLGLQTFSVVALATTSSTVRPDDLGGLGFVCALEQEVAKRGALAHHRRRICTQHAASHRHRFDHSHASAADNSSETSRCMCTAIGIVTRFGKQAYIRVSLFQAMNCVFFCQLSMCMLDIFSVFDLMSPCMKQLPHLVVR